MKSELYEENYQDPRYFSFGQNWKKFLEHLSDEQIREAELSLKTFLGGREAIAGKTFVDIGCGSGLFSLAAYRLGAKEIVSVDIDEASVWCAKKLHAKAGSPLHWKILTGSALDKNFIDTLGKFDVVYSWGVLHHTGNMKEALKNVRDLSLPEGKLYIALYNKNTHHLECNTPFWHRIKRDNNKIQQLWKRILETLYADYILLGLLLHGQNPFRYVTKYKSLRGMDFFTDIRDWLGGYPYEYAPADEIISSFAENGFLCLRLNPARSIGCNEFLFFKNT